MKQVGVPLAKQPHYVFPVKKRSSLYNMQFLFVKFK
jgi:hypothetical protein